MKSISSIIALVLAGLFAFGFYHRASEAKRLRELLDAEREEFRQYKAAHPEHELPKLDASSTPSTGRAPKAEVSICEEEENRLMREMSERRARGEYFLQSEFPGAYRQQERWIKESVAKIAAENSTMYSNLFSELGVPPEQNVFLQHHLSKIRLASINVSQAVGELGTAQEAFKKRAAGLMDKDSYAKYSEFERTQPARRELDSIKSSLKQAGEELDPRFEERLLALVKESGAHRHYSGGPFDEPETPVVGPEAIVAHLEKKVQTMKDFTSLLARRVQDEGLPENVRTALNQHYADWLTQEERSLASMRTHLESEKRQGE